MEQDELLRELKYIKIALYICVVCLIVIIVKPLLPSITTVKESQVKNKLRGISKTIVNEERKPIWNTSLVKDIFKRGELEVVIEMCNNRINEYPNDAEGYWYRAKAFRMLGKYEDALVDLDKAESLAPGWRKKYTGPLRNDIIRQKIKNKINEKVKNLRKDNEPV